ncbi:hypothetical protein QFZ66_005891 [Streptomyces sp. B4I13]|uniref:hypothetical protein n=1 Tax=Streptomyces sp. B4I13 TaxID=3042271 RepID=UPI002782AD74|nr:hypothetical protein [Streptomyces sp. B4I13]MDQ0962013.1 hypothetical protein [Streptomyces sp. B4I13]
MSTRPPITLNPDLDPWERQPNETPHKHGQFTTYRDLGRTRTLTEAAQRLTLAYGHVRNLAAQYRWRDRVEAYDRHLDRQYEAMWLEERRKAAENDAKILGAAVGKLAQRLQTLRADEMSVGDFTRLMDVTFRNRRALFKDPTDTFVVTSEGTSALAQHFAEFAQMGPEQRRARLGELAASVNQRIRAVDGGDDEDDEDEEA